MSKLPDKKKSFWQKLWNSRLFWVTVSLCGVAIVAGLLVWGIKTGNPEGDPLVNAYHDLSIPSTWHQTDYSQIGGISCAAADVSCPAKHYTYTSSDNNPQAQDKLTQIRGQLSKQGYRIEHECLNEKCADYSLTVYKDEVTVRVTSQEGDPNGRIIHLDIENK